MVASAPEAEIPDTVTVLPVPTFLSAVVAEVLASVTVSPATLSFDSETVMVVAPLYTRFVAVAVTVSVRAVMFAVADGAPETLIT